MGHLLHHSPLSPRRRVLTLRPRKYRGPEPCLGLSFPFRLHPGRSRDSFRVRFHAIEMYNHLFLPSALLYTICAAVQSFQHPPYSVSRFEQRASGVFVIPILLALLFHASSLTHVTVQTLQILTELPDVLAGCLLWLPVGLVIDEIDRKSHFLAVQDSAGCRGRSVMDTGPVGQ
ncbi:hypothetical protein T06_4226 [Trichinella sp. T6]|nr:hypothetical protein T06_4226 [Trichinella sp. T6]